MTTSTLPKVPKALDDELLQHIDTLRTLRLHLAETMLKDLAGTSEKLKAQGLDDDLSQDDLRNELHSKITMLKERLQNPKQIYPDELDMCLDLMEDDDIVVFEDELS